ncbi:ENTH domain containing protein [Fragilaria crotonensis]|nr:ENTH domain containing protein [Fragilaria crotonensis]
MADRSLLARATEGTIAPTPGYLYLDIAKNVATSPMACQEVATYLSRRLQSKQNPNIKYKCLKVIAKVAESPVTRGMFKRTMAQDSQSMACIKEALQFRGPPDPARGDEPYQKVRTAAKEAMDAIYSDAPTSTSASHAGDYGNAYGAAVGGHAGPPTPSTRMEGIGNPMFKDPRDPSNQPMTAETFLREAAEAVTGMIRDPLARNVDLGPPPGPRPGAMPGYGGGGTYPPGRSQLAQSTGGQWTMASNRGPHAVNPPANFQQDSAYYQQKQAYDWASKSGSAGQSGTSGVGGSWGAPSVVGATPASYVPSNMNPQQPHIGIISTQTTHGHGGTAVSDGQFEKQLVMELCPPGGLKAEPPPDKLQKFVQTVPSLDADLVCPALLDCLEEGQPWIIRAKALCVMEACITVGPSGEPAQRVMTLLGLSPSDANRNPASAPTTANSFPPPVAAPPAPSTDLLDFGDTTAAPPMPPVPPPAVPPSPPTQNSSGALFGGLKVQEKVVPAPSKPADAPVESLLQGMTINKVSAAQGGSGFGFMQASEPSAPPAGSAFGFMQATEPAAPPYWKFLRLHAGVRSSSTCYSSRQFL